ncbi:MAG: serine/threonine-protein kinase, partial [Clostridia bacterium]|nr:serine/threonine-protein kinase [Clostridia bacterium]
MRMIEDNVSTCPHCGASVPYIQENPVDLPAGTLLRERFIIGRSIGHGGYGITYIAYDRHLTARRAIKEYFPKDGKRGKNLHPIPPEGREADVARTREHFLQEARMMTAARDSHVRNVVQVFDQFDENNTSYILMEYLDGMTIDDYINRVTHGDMPWKEAVGYACEALRALQDLHDAHMIHRDISANNIFLRQDKTICLIDFGSAEFLDTALQSPGKLWPSSKRYYTPREQRERRPQGAYTDVYAMAVVLYKMLVGYFPAVARVSDFRPVDEMAPAKAIPPAIAETLKDALRENERERIQTADEMRMRLEKAAGFGTKRMNPKLRQLLATAGTTTAAIFVVLGLGAATGGIRRIEPRIPQQAATAEPSFTP